jgi:hypothetical protein
MCPDNGRKDRHLFLSQIERSADLVRVGSGDGTPLGNRSSPIGRAAVAFVKRPLLINVANNGL